MKKLLALSAALFVHLNISYAYTELYGGIGAGLNQFMPERRVDDTIVLDPPLPFPTTSSYNQDSTTGGNLAAFIGLKEKIDQLALALELKGNWSSAETEAKTTNYFNNNVTAVARVREYGNISISLLPGVYLNNKTEIFLTGGYIRGKFEAKSAGDTGGNLIATGQTSRWLSGFVIGGGLETSLSPCINARLEYNYKRYQNIKQNSVLPPEINFNQDVIQSKVTPQDHLVLLSVIFHAPIEKLFART